MLRVEDVHVVRHKVLVEGLSRRQAARELGISRNTVRRYLTLAEPVRVEREPRRKAVLERVQPRLDVLLEEWSGRTTAKQRPTATRLHRQLREEGYEVGETLVRDYLREWRRQRAEVYVPLVHRPGDETQSWRSFFPAATPALNAFDTFQTGARYWIAVTAAVEWMSVGGGSTAER